MKVAFKLDAPSTFSEYERERIKENLGGHAGPTLGRQKLRANAASNRDVTSHVLEARANDSHKGRAVGVVAGIDDVRQDHRGLSRDLRPPRQVLLQDVWEDRSWQTDFPAKEVAFVGGNDIVRVLHALELMSQIDDAGARGHLAGNERGGGRAL